VADLVGGGQRGQVSRPFQPVPRQHRGTPHHHRQRNADDHRCQAEHPHRGGAPVRPLVQAPAPGHRTTPSHGTTPGSVATTAVSVIGTGGSQLSGRSANRTVTLVSDVDEPVRSTDTGRPAAA
jgi:hypothetical protein